MDLLIRFVVSNRHWRSGRRSGLFQAIDEILETPDHYLGQAIEELVAWFNQNLATPFRDDEKQKQPGWKIEPATGALSWTKASAVEHMSKLRQLTVLVEEAGWIVEEISTTKPGLVLYEDEFQVVAQPFADTPT